ncbi:leucyl/phenylalanyl-tRNA--protein transferase [Shewanella youngdeokensis]|uniref:Leucyl/phenylalanyl-tRNA--protein transferase n=1 Tax=Shewanella youngdeokensis TaxID=2999068 RepID=A0ABZ0K2A7_9GAMM|nr:leucyl/phenylalanyl-tRNA--protein transferase [Shewanella sp. DAU334]
MNKLSYLNPEQLDFPPAEQALRDPNGLLAVGGDLQPDRLLNAYYNGIFPWFNQDDPILWWSPDPRAVFIPGSLNISRSLVKYLKKQQWTFTINKQFSKVMQGCAAPRAKQDGTWITADIQQAYLSLHQQGRAHSIEVWENDTLIGGLYGLAIGQVFCGESMFHLRTNASKAAMIVLQQHLLRCGFKLIDAQVENDHLSSMGSKSISRNDFLELLRHLRNGNVNSDSWLTTEVKIEL